MLILIVADSQSLDTLHIICIVFQDLKRHYFRLSHGSVISCISRETSSPLFFIEWFLVSYQRSIFLELALSDFPVRLPWEFLKRFLSMPVIPSQAVLIMPYPLYMIDLTRDAAQLGFRYYYPVRFC